MIGNSSGGVSRKIEDENERKKLKEIMSGFDLPQNLGVIIRTAGMGRTKIELQKDLQMLLKIWETIQEKYNNPNQDPPFPLYQVPGMVVRTVRDHYTADTSEIVVDTQAAYKELRSFFKLVMPRMQNRVKLYSNGKPLFSQYDIERQIESIYQRRVPLPSGGSLVLDSGEALVAIDVNSGKTTSASELEETALRTNLEAANEIGRQLRLRDLGGLIVVDFIDMFQKKNKGLVERQLKQACKKDKARINISRISKFGLLEMSRQRLSPPVGEGRFDRCIYCDGTGFIKSESALVLGVLRRVQEMISTGRVKTLRAEVDSRVINYLINNKMNYLTEFEEKQGVKILFDGKAGLRPEDYNFSILESREETVQESKPKGRSRTASSRRVIETVKEETAPSGDDKPRSSKGQSHEGSRRKYTRKSIARKTPAIRGRGRKKSTVSPTKESISSEEIKILETTQEPESPIVVSSVIPKESTEEVIPQEKVSEIFENPVQET